MSRRAIRAEERALEAYARLVRASDLVVARVERALLGEPGARGLSYSQLVLLQTVRRSGPLHQQDLGAKLVRSKANVTSLLDGLQRAGLVRRERNAADRRYVAVHLTPAGEAMVDALQPAFARAVTTALGVLDDDDQERLGRLARKLAKGIRAQTNAAIAAGGPAPEPVAAAPDDG
jgi:MarR family 2-MHQ and catechol resistance regulon transcriptional repressor